ncbi:filamentous hemagglutinin, partial [Burkholderia gladioli]
GGISVSTMGGSASFSSSKGNASGNYAGVNEQAGIQAGDGGFNVNVKGNTALTGAVISSTADPSKNTLTTSTLTTSDIANHSAYNADSSGLSAGAGVGVTGKAVGPGSVSGSGGVTPMISQSDSGNESATTRSGVSAGTINVTNPAGQTQDLANLNRDTSNLNGTVSKTPDVQHLLDKQADTMNAAQAAGQVVAQGIGAYADMKRDAALATAKDATTAAKAAMQAGDTEAAAAYAATASQALADAKSWTEGGSNRAILQISGGALIGGLGGSSAMTGALGGAAGAGMSSLLAGQTSKISGALGDASGSSLLGNVVGNILSGLGGMLVGGSAGAATASAVNLYNQGHDKNENEAQKEIAELRKELDKERAMLGQVNLTQRLEDGLSTIPATSVTGMIAGGKSGTTGSANAPVYNPRGAASATKFGDNWSGGSLSESVNSVAGPNPQVTYTESGKTIYTNPTTGTSVVYDNAGNYYRVQSSTGQYLDKNGNPIPNNVPLVGANKTTQTGIPPDLRQGLTHFKNTDPSK